MTRAAWRQMARTLGADARLEESFEPLVARWSEPHRRYHTLQHLRECLALLADARSLAAQPAEIEAALWFHDAFYDPLRDDNEQRSADWAHAALRGAGVAPGVAERVRALVMATRHGEVQPATADARLLVDIDLAILGAPAARFDESDAQVRAEYAHVSAQAWREGRGRVLSGFLARPQLYLTARFREAREARARVNLQRALERLAATTAA